MPLPPPPSTHTLQLLQSLIGLVVLPTCPLSVDERDNFLDQLSENLDTFFFVAATETTPPVGGAGNGNQMGGRSRSGAFLNRIPSPTKSFTPPSGGGASSSGHPHFSAVSIPSRSMLSHRRGSLQNLNSSPLSSRNNRGMMKRGTPPLTERRGSLSDLRFAPSFKPEKRAENIVSFEDMIRNSPNARKRLADKKVGFSKCP